MTAEDSLLPPRNFAPFFALVEDGASGEVAHPAVHYVFEDDDPDVITAASLRALGADDGSVNTMRRVSSEIEGEMGQRADEPRDVLPPLRPGVQERYVLVELGQDGHSVVSAKSLSADWAVTGTSIGAAPTFDEGAEDPNQAGGLMLKVEGLGGNLDHLRKRDRDADREFEEKREAAGGDSIAAMTQLVEGLRKKMLVLDKVMLDSEDGQEES